MDEKQLKRFLTYIVNNDSLTFAQKTKRDQLLVRDMLTLNQLGNKPKKEKNLSPRQTAEFLSLFNNPEGLKYLTHGYPEGEYLSIQELVERVNKILNEYYNRIPGSLYSCIRNFVYPNGCSGNNWLDYNGVKHSSTYANPEWQIWADKQKKHPKCNDNYVDEIEAFRHTMRITDGILYDFLNGIKVNYKNIDVLVDEKIKSTDVYTNNFLFFSALKRILGMMNRRNARMVEVRRERVRPQKITRIIITQKDSFSTSSIDDVLERLTNYEKPGDFGEIRSKLEGYCLWEVQSLWAGEPYSLQLLNEDNAVPQKVSIAKEGVTGFSHIFTFYNI